MHTKYIEAMGEFDTGGDLTLYFETFPSGELCSF